MLHFRVLPDNYFMSYGFPVELFRLLTLIWIVVLLDVSVLVGFPLFLASPPWLLSSASSGPAGHVGSVRSPWVMVISVGTCINNILALLFRY